MKSYRRNVAKTKRKSSARSTASEPKSNNSRAALLLRCSAEEAAAIRASAMAERRTISGFILNATAGRIRRRELTTGRAADLRASKANGHSGGRGTTEFFGTA